MMMERGGTEDTVKEGEKANEGKEVREKRMRKRGMEEKGGQRKEKEEE